ncbi:MAG: response regulator transcription factor [Polyangiales bacterium]
MPSRDPSQPLRVFVADDHAIVCEGLRRWCETMPTLAWVGATHDGNDLLLRCAAERWDVLVLDLSLPGRTGTELLREVLAVQPNLRVVVYSMYPPEDYAAWALSAGASAYVSKTAPLDNLRAALLGRGPAEAPRARVLLPHERLSAREAEVFLAVAGGRTPQEASWDLDMAPSTVSTHLKAIRTKLGVRSLLEVVQYATRHGLTGPKK